MTVLAASGDSGAADVKFNETTYYLHPVTSWPDSDPLVTGVGGTQLRQSAKGAWHSVVWNDTYNVPTQQFIFGNKGPNPLAGGGGKSVIFSRPKYQNSVAGVTGAARGVPDISMSGACNGAVDMYQSFKGQPAGWYPTCGTSEATPLFAGVVALADQVAGHPLGLINPALYEMSAMGAAAGIVDVTKGNNTVSFPQGGKVHTVTGFSARPGYDLASGVGTVNAALLRAGTGAPGRPAARRRAPPQHAGPGPPGPARATAFRTHPAGERLRIPIMSTQDVPGPRPGLRPLPEHEEDLGGLLTLVAQGDETAFEAAYDRLARPVYGLIRKVLRDPAQSEEVAQEVLLEVWRTASRFDATRGSAMTWVMTIAHRRAVDRVRSVSAETQREQKVSTVSATPPEGVAETVESRLDAERVRRCLDSLTELQRQSITLAYYGGYTYPEVASLLSTALGTIKTRVRDGLIRMRDCMGVSW